MRDLQTVVDDLTTAIDLNRGVLPAGELTAAQSEVAEALDRFERVGGHTVVAIVGGTGSGKSSLFNALTHSDFAEVGVIRPTTRRPAAYSWGSPARKVLDYLGLAPHEARVVDTQLRYHAESHLDGLVLLDLPDQDSVEERHATLVDELLPVVDLLIWMVDPQKYADHILHERYLGPLVARSDAMVVVLNRADELSADARAKVSADVRRILDEGGLDKVPVIVSSIPTGEGLDEIRARIAAEVADNATAQRTALAKIGSVAERLRGRLGDGDPQLDDTLIDETVEGLVRASGTDAVADSVERSMSRLTGDEVAPATPPSRPAVIAIGSGWSSQARRGLSSPWARQIDAALPEVDELLDGVSTAVSSVDVPQGRVKRADTLLALALGAFALGFLLLVIGSLAGWPGFVTIVLPLLALAGAGYLTMTSTRVRREQADEAAKAYSAEVREKVAGVVQELLVDPARTVLERRAEVRRALDSVIGN